MDLIIKITHLSFQSIRAYAVSVARKHPWGVDPTEHIIMFDIFLMLCNKKSSAYLTVCRKPPYPTLSILNIHTQIKATVFTVAFVLGYSTVNSP